MALAALILASSSSAGAPDPGLLEGEWRGEGRFLNTRFDQAHGPLPIRLAIDDQGALSGTVGAAAIGPEFIEYVCTLSGLVGMQPAFARKDHFVWLVVSADTTSLASNFHLKSNPWLDLGQHIGELKAERQLANN